MVTVAVPVFGLTNFFRRFVLLFHFLFRFFAGRYSLTIGKGTSRKRTKKKKEKDEVDDVDDDERTNKKT